MLECTRCHGTWVDAETFERICADREAQAAVLHQDIAARPQRESGSDVHYRPCLECGKMMNRLNFARLSGTIVDACKGHGTFLDAGELHAIVAFIQSGGLDRARQRQLDDIKDEERQLESLQQAEVMRDAAGVDRSIRGGAWNGLDLVSLLDFLKR